MENATKPSFNRNCNSHPEPTQPTCHANIMNPKKMGGSRFLTNLWSFPEDEHANYCDGYNDSDYTNCLVCYEVVGCR
jgi:hypothetical protein